MADRARVFVTRNLPGHAIDVLRETSEVEVWPEDLPPSPKTLQRRLRDSDAIFSLLTDKIDGELLEAAPNLLVVSNMARAPVGVFPSGRRRGLRVAGS